MQAGDQNGGGLEPTLPFSDFFANLDFSILAHENLWAAPMFETVSVLNKYDKHFPDTKQLSCVC